MKIKLDFVTNSSSTSFIIVTDGELNKKDFFHLVGVTEGSPLEPVFDALFEHLQANMEPISEHRGGRHAGSEELDSLIKARFSEQVAHKVTKALAKGKQVFIGELSSEEDEIETYFCCESFELENENIYFNALECVW